MIKDNKFELFYKPIVFVSKCIEFEHCRFNGNIISSDTVKVLKDHVDFITHCPEVEIGLGVPRDSIRIISQDQELKLIQPKTNTDLTQKMNDYAKVTLSSYKEKNIDGFILKSNSPSCAVSKAKVYPGSGKYRHVDNSPGFFGGKVRELFKDTIIEDEGRLRNFLIREHFYTTVFTLAKFRNIMIDKKPADLVEFHSRVKYLLMSYNQDKMRKLGKIVSKAGIKNSNEDYFLLYYKGLKDIFMKMPRTPNIINSIQHIMGYFKNNLSSEEKQFLNTQLEKFKNKKVPLSVPLNIIKSWVIRFKNEYLLKQFFFSPFPDELIEISDSGQGRNIR
ncbi:MAG: DUF523 and DUF1722 domain-containing protein [Candidatus Muirbacterium halophilum]|nr:DUF523 and DUF1722 domain-containing protein [Candidatus Muirbacterium halophilum]